MVLSKFKTYASAIVGISVGSLLYVILNPIPIIGPLLVGVTAGKISGWGLKRGFFVGLISGMIGYLLILFIFSQWISSWNIVGKLFVGTLLLLWNFFAILLTGIGGIIGAIFSMRNTVEERHRGDEEESTRVLVVCKNCKTTNPKKEKYCGSCGEKL